MQAARYHLVTRFAVDVAPDRLWECMVDVEDWPRWWRWLVGVDLVREGREDGTGTVFAPRVSSPLRYGLGWEVEIVEVVEPVRVDLEATGALDGWGRFELEKVADGTEVDFIWMVRTGKAWMNLLAPLARPVFVWSHDRLMDDFARGIAKTAGGRLLWVRHDSVRPGAPGFFRPPID